MPQRNKSSKDICTSVIPVTCVATVKTYRQLPVKRRIRQPRREQPRQQRVVVKRIHSQTLVGEWRLPFIDPCWTECSAAVSPKEGSVPSLPILTDWLEKRFRRDWMIDLFLHWSSKRRFASFRDGLRFDCEPIAFMNISRVWKKREVDINCLAYYFRFTQLLLYCCECSNLCFKMGLLFITD